MNGNEWRFTDEVGAERTAFTEELRAMLLVGAIEPTTLVWRAGMSEWAAAGSVPELQTEFAQSVAGQREFSPPGRRESRAGAPTLIGVESPLKTVRPPVPQPGRAATPGANPPEGGPSGGIARPARGHGSIPPALARPTERPAEPARPTARPPIARPAPRGAKAPTATESSARRKTLLGMRPVDTSGRVDSGAFVGSALRSPPVPRIDGERLSDEPARKTSPRALEPAAPPRRARRPLPSSHGASSGTSSGASHGALATPASLQHRTPPPPPPHHRTPPPPPMATRRPAAPAETLEMADFATIDTSDEPATNVTVPPVSAPTVTDVAGHSGSSSSPELPPHERTETLSLASPEDFSGLMGGGAGAGNAPEAPLGSVSSPTELRRQETMEMQLVEHHFAANQDPNHPSLSAPATSPTGEGTGSEVPSALNSPAPSVGTPAPLASDRPVDDGAFSAVSADPVRGFSPATPLEEVQEAQSSLEEAGSEDVSGRPSDPDDNDPFRRRRRGLVEVPVRSVLGVSAAWVLGLVAFFLVGRVSGFKSAARAPNATEGLQQAFLIQERELGVGPSAGAGKPIPCWSARRPVRYAASASKSVPIDLRPVGELMSLGFAVDDKNAIGLSVNPSTGAFEERFKKEVPGPIVRVSGLADGGFVVSEKADATRTPIDGSKVLVISKESVGLAEGEGSPKELWALSGEEPVVAEQGVSIGDGGWVSFRRGNAVFGGFYGPEGARGPLAEVTTGGGKVGKPRSASNGAEVAIVFSERPNEEEGTSWQLRLARGPVGGPLGASEVITLPPGGPGGDAIAPDLVGLSNGRWLLMWTEGSAGERAISAQTYDASWKPIGDPIALSPPAGNFGQATLGVVGTYTNVAFLQAAEEGFELWGAVLQCDL